MSQRQQEAEPNLGTFYQYTVAVPWKVVWMCTRTGRGWVTVTSGRLSLSGDRASSRQALTPHDPAKCHGFGKLARTEGRRNEGRKTSEGSSCCVINCFAQRCGSDVDSSESCGKRILGQVSCASLKGGMLVTKCKWHVVYCWAVMFCSHCKEFSVSLSTMSFSEWGHDD